MNTERYDSSEEPTIDSIITEVDDDKNSVREQLAAANARADENFDRFRRALADYDNYKKRVERDLQKILTERRRVLIERFLPVLDNLERALASDSNKAGLRDGVERTLRGFEAVLAAEGVRPIDVRGKTFDPRIAEAVGTAAASDGVADDTVVEVSEKGYMLDDELLRPAKVIVAKQDG